ncbi:MAG: sulfatase-like hydrolase/transferase, partial [Vicinamibacterales bacterium]
MASKKKRKSAPRPAAAAPATDRPAAPSAASDRPAAATGDDGAGRGGRGPMLAAGLVLLAAIAGAGFWWTRGTAYALTPAADQNVLLVTIDTLRGDALGSYGGRAATPNLDRLAAGGARFTFAHSQAVVTLPSHTSILTGHYPYEHGVRDNSGYRVPDGTVTLATRLKAAGFATGAF